jgi:RimJ/RimL family protein N-acetyltransferase
MMFETERLHVRKLILEDLLSFHKMQSNPNVMRYADGEVNTLEAHALELSILIDKYTLTENDFWIYAIERRKDHCFVGTVALVKDGEDDEIGMRFLEEYWNLGYGAEVCKSTLQYCKQNGIQKIVASVVDLNSASSNILKRLGFKQVKKIINEEMQLPETKYELYL